MRVRPAFLGIFCHFTTRHFWGFPLYHPLDEKGRFPTLQPLFKTKLLVQA